MGDFTFSTEPNANYNVEEPKADGEYQQMPPVEMRGDQCQYDDAEACEILAEWNGIQKIQKNPMTTSKYIIIATHIQFALSPLFDAE